MKFTDGYWLFRTSVTPHFAVEVYDVDVESEALVVYGSTKHLTHRAIPSIIHYAKSEFGWDEFQAVKYKVWEHHLALTIMASWFITKTRLDWAQKYARNPQLLEKYETDVLPKLSTANVRELLRATMPLPQLTPLKAAELVVKHLDNRTRSRQSRQRKALSP